MSYPSSSRSLALRLAIALGIAVLGGSIAYAIQRTTTDVAQDPTAGRADSGIGQDLVELIPTSTPSPEPSETPRASMTRRARQPVTVPTARPRPAASAPGFIDELPAAPEQPEPVNPGELPRP